MSTKIEWTHFPGYKGVTLNPWDGCSRKKSPGCANCYAESWSKRNMGTWKNRDFTTLQFTLQFYEKRIREIYHWALPRCVFVNSMADFFDPKAPDEWRDQFIQAAIDNPKHLFLILTKEHKKLLSYTTEAQVPDNVWMGVSVENQTWANRRIPVLADAPIPHRFLSVEPQLGQINLTQFPQHIQKIHWIICGGESGINARYFNVDWAKSLKNQCQHFKIPFFFKQFGANHDLSLGDRKGSDWRDPDFPDELKVREFPILF